MSKMASVDEAELVKQSKQLQERLGTSLRVYIERFQNWGRNQKALVLSVKPKSLSDIQTTIRAAKELGLRVRCVGSSHSWSPLFSDDGHISMYMGDLQPENGKPKIKLNQEAMTVTVLGSTTSGELLKFQLDNDVCLMSNVTLESVHMAGLTAVGCHGAAKDEPCVSDYVTEMKIVDSNGNLRIYDGSNPEVFKAVQCNMGLFGVVYEITLKVEPMKIIETTSNFPTAKDCMLDPEKMMELTRQNWCTEIFWFPFNGMSYIDTLMTKLIGRILPGWSWYPENDHCWVRTMNKVDVPSQPLPRDEDYLLRRGFAFAENAYIRFLTDMLVKGPSKVPGFLKAGVREILERFVESKVSEKLPMGIHYDSWVDLCPTTGVEFVFDVNDEFEDYQLASNACKIVMNVTNEFGCKGHFPVNITMQIRWTATSQCLMGPGTKKNDGDTSTHSFYLCIVSVSGTPSWMNFVKEVARRLVKLPKKPHFHWAKQWGDIPAMGSRYLREIYKENITKFNQALEKSQADPIGMFHNQKLKEVILTDHGESLEVRTQNGDIQEDDDAIDGILETDVPDMPDGDTLKRTISKCKAYESQWKDMCEHFAANYLTLENKNVDNAQVSRDDMYYRQRLAELDDSDEASSGPNSKVL